MATYRLRHFSRIDTLKSIEPERLWRLLEPYRDFLAESGIAISDGPPIRDLHCSELTELLAVPNARMPLELIDALYYVDELATPQGMEALLSALNERSQSRDGSLDITPADLAVQVWLEDPELLRRVHAEIGLSRPRTFQYYQTDRATPYPLEMPTPEKLRHLELALDECFAARGRGCGAQVIPARSMEGLGFAVRHGDPYRREGVMDPNGATVVFYRPEKWDRVVYDQQQGELRINARADWEKELYRRLIGQHLFGDAEFFPGRAKYTLTPLQCYGEAALNAIDVDGLEWIRLVEIQLYRGIGGRVLETYRADGDLFNDMDHHHREGLETGRLIRAGFVFKTNHCRKPRSLVLRPSNIAQFRRDEDSWPLQQWMQQRGFLSAKEVHEHDYVDPILAIA